MKLNPFYFLLLLLLFAFQSIKAQQQPDLPPALEWQVFRVDSVTNDTIDAKPFYLEL